MAPEEDAAMEDADPENVSGASEDDSDSASEDDSDSGSDSDDGDEDVAMPDESATAKIMKLERRLESDPGDYGAHVQLCASLREWPSLRRRLRDAREAFAERFPLNETQWREWISDEVRATKGRRKRRGKVVGALFERAVADYQSVALWLGYAEFSLDQGWDVPARRSLYERALELAGLHFVDGHKIWAAYRAFELSKLELDVKNDPPAVAKQEETVRALLRRQLAVPHAQLDETLSACERWEASRPAKGPTIDPAPIAKAKAEAAARQPLERALAAAEEKGDTHALAKAHGAYLDFELSNEKSGSATGQGSARARAAFERAVSATPTSAQLWRRYTDHLDHVVRVHTLSAAAHERACRNCQRDGETWAAWIRYHARHRLEELGVEDAGAGENLDDVLKVYEECEEIMNRGVLCGPDTGDDALAIFLAQCHVVQRCERPSLLEERLGGRHVLTKARETLAEFYPGWVDRDMALPRLFADAFPAHGAQIWESYVRLGVEFGEHGPRGLNHGEFKGGEYAGVAEAWIGYANRLFESASRPFKGNENEDGSTPDADAASSARAVFKSVYARANLVSAHGGESGQARLCRAWLDFELRRGDPVTYAAADARAGVVLRRLEAEDRERKLEGPDPEEAKRLRRANDPNYKGPKGPGDGARKRKADDDVDADVDADAGADVDSWRGVFASSVRVLGVWKAGFGGGDDDAGRRGCVANFFVNSKMAGGAVPTHAGGESPGAKESGEDPSALRDYFLERVLPPDDARGDHDATVIALAVNCAASHRLRLLWKLYGAVVDRFGLTKNDAHLSAGDAQVRADFDALVGGENFDDVLNSRRTAERWTRGTPPRAGARDACPRLTGAASNTHTREEEDQSAGAGASAGASAGEWTSESAMQHAFGVVDEADEADVLPTRAASRADPDEARHVLVKPAKVEKSDEDSAYDRAREKVEAIKREREEVVLRDFDGARYLR